MLAHRLAESIFYLHSQPPLFNLYVGILLKAFPDHYASVAHATYVVIGIIGALALYGLLVRVGCGARLSAAIAALVTVAPATILFENWLFYEYPVAVMLVLSGFALAGFARKQTFWPGFAFFLLLAVVIWTRSTFHIVWMLLAAGLVLVSLRNRAKVVLCACLVPLLLVVALYGKNLVVFGEPSTSSWFGMHWARSVFRTFPPAERAERVERGELSRVSLVTPFSNVGDYRGIVPLSRPTGIPVLDQASSLGGRPNYNNKSYIRISNLYLHDSLRLIRGDPIAYLRGVKASLEIFLRPGTENPFTTRNGAKIRRYTEVFDRGIYLQTPYAARIGWAILGSYALALLYGVRLLLLWIRRGLSSDPALVTLLYAWLTVLNMCLANPLTSGGENNRIRFPVDPFVAVLVTCALVEAWPALRRRLTEGR